GSANADTAQLSHRQQQEQTVSDSDSNLAKELREQPSPSQSRGHSVQSRLDYAQMLFQPINLHRRNSWPSPSGTRTASGVDSDSESTRGSVRNYALASLNRKVSDQSFSAAPDAAAAAASPAASKPPAPRRNLSRPLRPSPSQTGPPSSSESLQSSAPAASGPLANPDRSLQEALTRVQASDWQAKCEGLQLVQRLAANHPEVAAREMHPLTLAVIGEVKNLRSQVSRLAMSTLGCLLQHLGKRMDAELEQCAKILLQKGSETNKFIQEDAESALMSMVEHCNQGRALGAIIQGGASHKSSQVRSLCAQILSELCDRMGPGRVLSGVNGHGSQETRYWGRTILYPLLGHQDFDALISKHVSPAVMRNLKDVLENLRLKGVGDQPPSTFSAGTKSRRGNSAGSADSASLAGSYASTSTTGQSAPLGRQRGAAGSNSRLSDAAADLVKTACQRLNAPDWKERLSGIDQLAELSQERTDLVGQCIVKVWRAASASRVINSKQQHALETALQLVHPLRNYLPTVANTLVQHAAPVLSSKSAELASLAGQLLDIFILEVDSEKLAQPFVQAVATGNPRSKPELVDKLAALAERLAPRKPRLSQLHLEPELFRLLGGLASAPGAGSVALKSSAYRLAQTLASYSGPAELLDRARSNAQCTPQAVSMLEDALRQY
uniref:TOG domain-containing protein n=1 Tax=Macrostomum lignano TaxID=282301 RepID=A0A1I8GHC7_9PLAT